jgi:hypothetical protein
MLKTDEAQYVIWQLDATNHLLMPVATVQGQAKLDQALVSAVYTWAHRLEGSMMTGIFVGHHDPTKDDPWHMSATMVWAIGSGREGLDRIPPIEMARHDTF